MNMHAVSAQAHAVAPARPSRTDGTIAAATASAADSATGSGNLNFKFHWQVQVSKIANKSLLFKFRVKSRLPQLAYQHGDQNL
jgi:hypothetical protein